VTGRDPREPDQRITLTHGRNFIEVVTPAGVIRIMTGITEFGTECPRVSVEMELTGRGWVIEEIMGNSRLKTVGITQRSQ
jgi:hypothetical protein